MERSPPSPSSVPVQAPTTTFVQTDQSTFKELVQRLTGPTGTSTSVVDNQQCQLQRPPQQQPYPHHHSLPPSPTGKHAGIIKRRPAFKAQTHRPKLTILKPGPVNPMIFTRPNSVSPATKVAGLSIRDKERSPSVELNEEEEEKAIKERRFYLHPSPTDRTNVVEPELLTLFPLTSPGTSGPG